MSGQLYAPATLSPGKKPPAPIEQEAGWAAEPVWTTWRRKFLTLPGLELRPLSRRRYTDYAIPAPRQYHT
jgi:hypothetical protein